MSFFIWDTATHYFHSAEYQNALIWYPLFRFSPYAQVQALLAAAS